jgi:hypothetical protein
VLSVPVLGHLDHARQLACWSLQIGLDVERKVQPVRHGWRGELGGQAGAEDLQNTPRC